MVGDRHLDWEGCFNARDLGGLRTADGHTTAWGALVRADELDHLTDAGWAELRSYGIRTIVDLRNDEERHIHPEPPAAGITIVHVPLDDIADTEFWNYCWSNKLDDTPLYYRPFLDRKPQRSAAAVAAIARAEAGGVLFHCGGGRDRTGLIALLLLSLAGVVPEDIVADYELSNTRLPPFWAMRGWADQRPVIEDIMERKNTSARAILLELLESLDAQEYLRSAGLDGHDLASVRGRLLGPEDRGVPSRWGPMRPRPRHEHR